MPKLSAGLLLYRYRADQLEVFLVHPGGPFWKNKDAGAWSLPKGEYLAGEEPLDAAKREFQEETGFAPPDSDFIPLDRLRQPGGKIVTAWAIKCDCERSEFGNRPESEHGGDHHSDDDGDAAQSASERDSAIDGESSLESSSAADGQAVKIQSNTFSLEWPPKSGRMQQFPEVDRAAWFPLATARTKILPGQATFLDRLTAHLADSGPPAGR